MPLQREPLIETYERERRRLLGQGLAASPTPTPPPGPQAPLAPSPTPDVSAIGVEGWSPKRGTYAQLPADVQQRIEDQVEGPLDNSLKNVILAHYSVFGTWPSFSLTADVLAKGEVRFDTYEEALSFFEVVKESYVGTGREWKLDASRTTGEGEPVSGAQMQASQDPRFTAETDVLDPEMITSFAPKKVEDFLLGPYMKRSKNGKTQMFRDGTLRLDEMLVAVPRQWAISQLGESLGREGRLRNPDLAEDERLMMELNRFLAQRVPKEYRPAPTAAWQEQTEKALRFLQMQRAAAVYIASAKDGEASSQQGQDAAAYLHSQGLSNLIGTLDQQIRFAARPPGSGSEQERAEFDRNAAWVEQMWVASRNPGITERMALHQLYKLNPNAVSTATQRQVGKDNMFTRFGMLTGWMGHVPGVDEVKEHVIDPGLEDLSEWIPAVASELGDFFDSTPGIKQVKWAIETPMEAVAALYEHRHMVFATAHQVEQDIGLDFYENPKSLPASAARKQAFAEYLTVYNRANPDAEKTGSFVDRWKFYWHNNQNAKEAGVPMQYTDELMRDTGHNPAEYPELSFVLGFAFDTVLDLALFRGAGLAASAAGKLPAGQAAVRGALRPVTLAERARIARAAAGSRLHISTLQQVTQRAWDASRMTRAPKATRIYRMGAMEPEALPGTWYDKERFVARLMSVIGPYKDDAMDLADALEAGHLVGNPEAKAAPVDIIEQAIEGWTKVGGKKLHPEDWAIMKRLKELAFYDESSRLHLRGKHPVVSAFLEKNHPLRKISVREREAGASADELASQIRTTVGSRSFRAKGDPVLRRALRADAESKRDWRRIAALDAIEDGDIAALADHAAGTYLYAGRRSASLLEQQFERNRLRRIRDYQFTERFRDLTDEEAGEVKRLQTLAYEADKDAIALKTTHERFAMMQLLDHVNSELSLRVSADDQFSRWYWKKHPGRAQEWLDQMEILDLYDLDSGERLADYYRRTGKMPIEAQRRSWMWKQFKPEDRPVEGVISSQELTEAQMLKTARLPEALSGDAMAAQRVRSGAQEYPGFIIDQRPAMTLTPGGTYVPQRQNAELSKAFDFAARDAAEAAASDEARRLDYIMHEYGLMSPEDLRRMEEQRDRAHAILKAREKAVKEARKQGEVTQRRIDELTIEQFGKLRRARMREDAGLIFERRLFPKGRKGTRAYNKYRKAMIAAFEERLLGQQKALETSYKALAEIEDGIDLRLGEVRSRVLANEQEIAAYQGRRERLMGSLQEAIGRPDVNATDPLTDLGEDTLAREVSGPGPVGSHPERARSAAGMVTRDYTQQVLEAAQSDLSAAQRRLADALDRIRTTTPDAVAESSEDARRLAEETVLDYLGARAAAGLDTDISQLPPELQAFANANRQTPEVLPRMDPDPEAMAFLEASGLVATRPVTGGEMLLERISRELLGPDASTRIADPEQIAERLLADGSGLLLLQGLGLSEPQAASILMGLRESLTEVQRATMRTRRAVSFAHRPRAFTFSNPDLSLRPVVRRTEEGGTSGLLVRGGQIGDALSDLKRAEADGIRKIYREARERGEDPKSAAVQAEVDELKANIAATRTALEADQRRNAAAVGELQARQRAEGVSPTRSPEWEEYGVDEKGRPVVRRVHDERLDLPSELAEKLQEMLDAPRPDYSNMERIPATRRPADRTVEARNLIWQWLEEQLFYTYKREFSDDLSLIQRPQDPPGVFYETGGRTPPGSSEPLWDAEQRARYIFKDELTVNKAKVGPDEWDADTLMATGENLEDDSITAMMGERRTVEGVQILEGPNEEFVRAVFELMDKMWDAHVAGRPFNVYTVGTPRLVSGVPLRTGPRQVGTPRRLAIWVEKRPRKSPAGPHARTIDTDAEGLFQNFYKVVSVRAEAAPGEGAKLGRRRMWAVVDTRTGERVIESGGRFELFTPDESHYVRSNKGVQYERRETTIEEVREYYTKTEALKAAGRHYEELLDNLDGQAVIDALQGMRDYAGAVVVKGNAKRILARRLEKWDAGDLPLVGEKGLSRQENLGARRHGWPTSRSGKPTGKKAYLEADMIDDLKAREAERRKFGSQWNEEIESFYSGALIDFIERHLAMRAPVSARDPFRNRQAVLDRARGVRAAKEGAGQGYWRPEKIISGGQAGADIAGLEIAAQLGIPSEVNIFAGFRPQGGAIIPQSAQRVVHGFEGDYVAKLKGRTGKNVELADATVIFVEVPIEQTKGSRFTASIAKAAGKPYIVIDVSSATAEGQLRQFLATRKPKTLNVAGTRTVQPGAVRELLRRAMSESAEEAVEVPKGVSTAPAPQTVSKEEELLGKLRALRENVRSGKAMDRDAALVQMREIEQLLLKERLKGKPSPDTLKRMEPWDEDAALKTMQTFGWSDVDAVAILEDMAKLADQPLSDPELAEKVLPYLDALEDMLDAIKVQNDFGVDDMARLLEERFPGQVVTTKLRGRIYEIEMKNGNRLSVVFQEQGPHGTYGALTPHHVSATLPDGREIKLTGDALMRLFSKTHRLAGEPLDVSVAHEGFHAVQFFGLLSEKEWKVLGRVFGDDIEQMAEGYARWLAGPDYKLPFNVKHGGVPIRSAHELSIADDIFNRIALFFRSLYEMAFDPKRYRATRDVRAVERTFSEVKSGEVWSRSGTPESMMRNRREAGLITYRQVPDDARARLEAINKQLDELSHDKDGRLRNYQDYSKEEDLLMGQLIREKVSLEAALDREVTPETAVSLWKEGEHPAPVSPYPFESSFEQQVTQWFMTKDDIAAIDASLATPEQIWAMATGPQNPEVNALRSELEGLAQRRAEALAERQRLLGEQQAAEIERQTAAANLRNFIARLNEGTVKPISADDVLKLRREVDWLMPDATVPDIRLSILEHLNDAHIVLEKLQSDPMAYVHLLPEPGREWQMMTWYYKRYNYAKLSRFLSGGMTRNMEFFNAYKVMFGRWSLDDLTTLYKTIVMAKIATMLRIPLADEFTRMVVTEKVNPIKAWREARLLKDLDEMPQDIQFKLSEIIKTVSDQPYELLDWDTPGAVIHYIHQARLNRRDATFSRYLIGRRKMEVNPVGWREQMRREVQNYFASPEAQRETNLVRLVRHYYQASLDNPQYADDMLFKSWYALGYRKGGGLRKVGMGTRRLEKHLDQEWHAVTQDKMVETYTTQQRGRGPALKAPVAGTEPGVKGDAQGLIDALYQDYTYWYDHPILGGHYHVKGGWVGDASPVEQAIVRELEQGRVPRELEFNRMDARDKLGRYRDWQRLRELVPGNRIKTWDGREIVPTAEQVLTWQPQLWGQKTFTGVHPTFIHKSRDMLYSILDYAGSKMNEMMYATSLKAEREEMLEHAKRTLGRELTQEELDDLGERAHFAARSYVERTMFTNTTYGGEEFLRNIVMFLPAYRQFAQYWLPYLATHPYALSVVARANQDRENWTLTVGGMQLDFSRMSFLVNQSENSVTGWLPSGAPLLTFPVSLGAHLNRGKQGNFWGSLAGTWPFEFSGEFSALNSPFDKIVYGATGYTLPWPFGTDPTKNTWRALQIQREALVNHDKKISAGDAMVKVRLQRLLEGGWNFISPVGTRIVEDDVAAMMQGKLDYAKAETPEDVQKVLDRPEMSAFKTFLTWENLPSYEQLDFIAKHPEIVPYAVSGFTGGENGAGSVGILYSQMKDAGIADPAAYLDRVDAKYDQINKVLAAERMRKDKAAEESWWRTYKAENKDLHEIERLQNEWETSSGAFAPGGAFYTQGRRGEAFYREQLNQKYLGISDPYTGISNSTGDAYRVAKFMDEMGGAGRALLQSSPNYEMYVQQKVMEQQGVVAQIVKDYVERRMSTRFTREQIVAAGFSESEADELYDVTISIDALWNEADRRAAGAGGYMTSAGREVRKTAIAAQNQMIHSTELYERFFGDNIAGLFATTYLTKPAYARPDFLRLDKLNRIEAETVERLLGKTDPDTGAPRLEVPHLPRNEAKLRQVAAVDGFVPTRDATGKTRWYARVTIADRVSGYVPVNAPSEARALNLTWKQTQQALSGLYTHPERFEDLVAVSERLEAGGLPQWARDIAAEDLRAGCWCSWLTVAGQARAVLRDSVNVEYGGAQGYSAESGLGKAWKARLLGFGNALASVSPEFASEWQSYNGDNEMVNAILGWYL